MSRGSSASWAATIPAIALGAVALVAAPSAFADGSVSTDGSTLFYEADEQSNAVDIHQSPGNDGSADDKLVIEDSSGGQPIPIISSPPCKSGDPDDTPEYPRDFLYARCPKSVGALDISLGAGDDDFAQADPYSHTPPLVTDLYLTARAGPGDDDVSAGDAGAGLEGEEGNDDLFGTDLGDVLNGGAGSDHLSGGEGNDWLDGDADGDLLWGGRGRDLIGGQEGNDKITDVGGHGYIDAGEGNDKVKAVEGPGDEIDCGPGRDRATVDKTDKVGRDCERVKRKK